MAEAVERYGNREFHVDRTEVRKNIWTRMAGALNIFQKKPYIEPDKCVRCGICVQSCPVPGKAVDFRNGKNKAPVYDYKKCIRCFWLPGDVPEEGNKSEIDLINKKHMTEDFFLLKSCAFLQ